MPKTKLGTAIPNLKGLSLCQIINKIKYSILAPLDPTYWPLSINKHLDILDIFVVNIPTNLHNVINNLL